MSLRDDKFEQELLKESEEGKKTIKRTIGKNTKEYRDMRRQSIKVTPNTTENFRKRQVFLLIFKIFEISIINANLIDFIFNY